MAAQKVHEEAKKRETPLTNVVNEAYRPKSSKASILGLDA